MAYKVSYKVVTEQGEQLKNIAKEMDNYINRINQIVSKLGSDELLQQVRGDLNKFKQQLEEEKTVLNLAGGVITDVVQNYSGTEKKSVGKVDKAKAHNRDFYKRPVAVASAGGAAAGAAGAVASGATASASSFNVGSISNSQTVSNTTNVFSGATSGAAGAGSAAATVAATAAKEVAGKGGSMAAGVAAAVGSVVAAGGAIVGVDALDKKKASKKKSES